MRVCESEIKCNMILMYPRDNKQLVPIERNRMKQAKIL